MVCMIHIPTITTTTKTITKTTVDAQVSITMALQHSITTDTVAAKDSTMASNIPPVVLMGIMHLYMEPKADVDVVIVISTAFR